MRLEDRTAVVVGVGSTVGKACALALAREGAQVLVVDPDETTATDVSAAIAERGGIALSHVAGFASEADALGVAERCESLWRRLDVLILCGSAKDWWALEDDTVAHWEEVIQTNLMGPIIYTKCLRGLLKRSVDGSVVYLGSVDGITGNPNLPAYSVSKGGLIPLTHVMAHTCGTDGIRVNCIAAAAIDLSGSGAMENLRGATSDAAERLRLTPLGRHAKPEEMASVALFFASSDSSYVSGTILSVDGGRTGLTPGTIMRGAEAR